MKTLVCLVEEPSARYMLEGVLPRLLPNINTHFIVFEGKQDLEKQLVKKIMYWQKLDSLFLVLRDQDSGDCVSIKNNLTNLCDKTGKKGVLVRIACRELESYYFGDLAAVEIGLGFSNNSLAKFAKKARYRIPDNIENVSDELLKITSGTYQKSLGSRAIGKYLSIENNTSNSFNSLIAGLKNLFG
ncbi:MAG: DUF4276 family protein [Defluviitaleaceae bacterium]|nr:DUF4276 family protein [Defluviitaleaceae bacterium]